MWLCVCLECSPVTRTFCQGKKAKDARKLARQAAEGATTADGIPCNVCGEVFSTRNKLFQHISVTGHALQKGEAASREDFPFVFAAPQAHPQSHPEPPSGGGARPAGEPEAEDDDWGGKSKKKKKGGRK